MAIEETGTVKFFNIALRAAARYSSPKAARTPRQSTESPALLGDLTPWRADHRLTVPPRCSHLIVSD
jgi:hypothetical protein